MANLMVPQPWPVLSKYVYASYGEPAPSGKLEHKIIRSDRGIKIKEYWTLNGRPYSINDQPAEIRYHGSTGKILGKYWAQDGIGGYRKGGPSVILYDNHGNVREESWFETTSHHRERGKTVIKYREDQSKPALTTWVNGKLRRQEWWVDGKRVKLETYK